MLSSMWSRQRLFNRNFVNFETLTNEERQKLTKEYALLLISEVNDLLGEINWKTHHRSDSVQVKKRDLSLEIIDIWKYLVSIALVWDVTPSDFCRYFDEKSSLVEQKYIQEFSSISDKEIVICDIDGVLSDYPKTFMSFVKRQYEHDYNVPVSIPSSVNSLDLYKVLDIPSDDLRRYKHYYRESGEIRSETPIPGAVNLLSELKSQGLYVVLLTSRPFDKYKSLYLDTYMWLLSNGFEFDALLYDSKKRDVVSSLIKSSNVRFIIDDDPRIVSNLESLDGLKRLYLVDRTYNQNVKCSDKVVRVFGYDEILSKECLD